MSREQEPDREALKRYLLGKTTPAELAVVEDALLDENDACLERLEAVEDELLDQCAEGALSAEEEASFTSYLSGLPEKREELRVALTLAGRAAAAPKVYPSYQQALAAAAVFVFALSAGWFARGLWAPGAPAVLTPEAGEAEAAWTLLLQEGRSRSDGALPTVSVSNTAEIDFELDLRAEVAPSYRAVFHDQNAREVFALSQLTSVRADGALRVSFELPSALLEPGDYFIVLIGLQGDAASPEPVARYDFRLLP